MIEIFAIKKCAETASQFRREVQEVNMTDLNLKNDLLTLLFQLMVSLSQLRLSLEYESSDSDVDYLVSVVRKQIADTMTAIRKTKWKNARISEVEEIFYNVKRYLT